MTFGDPLLAAQRQRGVEVGRPGAAVPTAAGAAPPRVVEITAAELPLACPRAGDPVCCSHPRVYLDILNPGEAQCPYCGTLYRLRAGEHLQDHHFGTRGLHQHRPPLPQEHLARRD